MPMVFPSRSFADLITGLTTNQCSDAEPQAAIVISAGGFFAVRTEKIDCGVPKMTSTSPARSAVVESVDCIVISSTSTPLRAKIPCSWAIQKGTRDEPMKSVLTRSFSRSWLSAAPVAKPRTNRTNERQKHFTLAFFLAINGFVPCDYAFAELRRARQLCGGSCRKTVWPWRTGADG